MATTDPTTTPATAPTLLQNGFTADYLEAHFNAWEEAAILANGGTLEDEPWTHVSTYLETIGERELHLVLMRHWGLTGGAASFYAFHNIVYATAAYMRDGVPSQAEIDEPVKNQSRALNGHRRPPHGCFFCARVHGDKCTEQGFTRDLLRLGYAYERASPPEYPLEPFPEEVAAEAEAEACKKAGPAGNGVTVITDSGTASASSSLPTNTEIAVSPPAPPERFVLGSPTTLVKDRHLLINLRRLSLPVVSLSPFMRPTDSYVVARHTGTLVLRPPQGAEPVQIDNALFAPEARHNIIGADVLLSDLWDVSAGVLTHVPTGAILPLQLETMPACSVVA